jgi:hypothetical protein
MDWVERGATADKLHDLDREGAGIEQPQARRRQETHRRMDNSSKGSK